MQKTVITNPGPLDPCLEIARTACLERDPSFWGTRQCREQQKELRGDCFTKKLTNADHSLTYLG